jgi:hypothetical protein
VFLLARSAAAERAAPDARFHSVQDVEESGDLHSSSAAMHVVEYPSFAANLVPMPAVQVAAVISAALPADAGVAPAT